MINSIVNFFKSLWNKLVDFVKKYKVPILLIGGGMFVYWLVTKKKIINI